MQIPDPQLPKPGEIQKRQRPAEVNTVLAMQVTAADLRYQC